MQGYTDPFNRTAFPWNNADLEMLDWYKNIIKIRNTNNVLINGDYKPLYVNKDVLAYSRNYADENIQVYINRSNNQHIIFCDAAYNMITEKQIAGDVILSPFSCMMLKKNWSHKKVVDNITSIEYNEHLLNSKK